MKIVDGKVVAEEKDYGTEFIGEDGLPKRMLVKSTEREKERLEEQLRREEEQRRREEERIQRMIDAVKDGYDEW